MQRYIWQFLNIYAYICCGSALYGQQLITNKCLFLYKSVLFISAGMGSSEKEQIWQETPVNTNHGRLYSYFNYKIS